MQPPIVESLVIGDRNRRTKHSASSTSTTPSFCDCERGGDLAAIIVLPAIDAARDGPS